jgi:hypothetical protein
MSVLFEARARTERVLHLREYAKYSYRIEVRAKFFETNIMSDLSYTFVNKMALVHALANRLSALVLQNHPKSVCTSARTSISRTTMRSRNVIL